MTDDREPPPDPFPAPVMTSPFPPLDVAPYSDAGDPPSDWNQAADAHDLPTQESRLIALGRFAFPPAPPLDDEGVAARDRRWTSRIVVVAGVFLLIFNAVSIQNWSRQQPAGWTTSTAQQLSDVWVAQLAQLGTDQPRQGVREAYRQAREARYVGTGQGK